MLLSTAYFPPVQYFTKIVNLDIYHIEACESYQKQSYRNRCEIFGANGVISLFVPIVKGRSKEQSIKNVMISYDTNWQKQHFKTIESAYRNSPFYEFYIEEIEIFWRKKTRFLYDLNNSIMEVLLDLTDLNNISLKETINYQNEINDMPDFRNIIHPKKSLTLDPEFIPMNYQQVFSDRYGFKANLSILDLLFQKGSETKNFLRSCIK